jgi:hypothetical protein
MKSLIPHNVHEVDRASQDRGRIAEIRDFVRYEFSKYFNLKGSQRCAPGHLIPENDDSVLFTGSTISTFKPYLIGQNIPQSGVHMVQSCLRTQNTKILYDITRQPQWASYFSSIGALANYEQLDSMTANTWELFTGNMGVPLERIVIRASSQDNDLCREWLRAGLQGHIEFDQKDPVYYTHKFGMDCVAGRNCNLAIRDLKTGEPRDIGNIIVIETPDHPLGMEIAFGVETIVSRLLGFPNPIAASLAADIVPVKNGSSLKLADALSSSIVILDSGERPIATNRGRVLRRYLQAVSDLRLMADVTIPEIRQYSEEFEHQEFGAVSEIPARMEKYIVAYEKLKREGLKPEKINERLNEVFPVSANNINMYGRTPLSSKYEPA